MMFRFVVLWFGRSQRQESKNSGQLGEIQRNTPEIQQYPA